MVFACTALVCYQSKGRSALLSSASDVNTPTGLEIKDLKINTPNVWRNFCWPVGYGIWYPTWPGRQCAEFLPPSPHLTPPQVQRSMHSLLQVWVSNGTNITYRNRVVGPFPGQISKPDTFGTGAVPLNVASPITGSLAPLSQTEFQLHREGRRVSCELCQAPTVQLRTESKLRSISSEGTN